MVAMRDELDRRRRTVRVLLVDDHRVFREGLRHDLASQEFEIVAKPEWEKIGLFEYVCDNNRCPGGKCGSQ